VVAPGYPTYRTQPRSVRIGLIVAGAGLAALIAWRATAGAAHTEHPSSNGVRAIAIDWAGLLALADQHAEPGWQISSAPIERIGYRKGSRHAIEVVPLGPAAVEVEIHTARAFLAMRAAAAAAGVELRLESGFRTAEQQRELYRAWRQGKGHKAARPGKSNHQSGRALDIAVNTMPGALAWLEANAQAFGFHRTVASEPWHWEYVEIPRARALARPTRKHTKPGKAGKPTPRAVRASKPGSRR
jgi:hypothetical protein